MNEELQSGPVIIPLSAYNVGFGGGVSEEDIEKKLEPINSEINSISNTIDYISDKQGNSYIITNVATRIGGPASNDAVNFHSLTSIINDLSSERGPSDGSQYMIQGGIKNFSTNTILFGGNRSSTDDWGPLNDETSPSISYDYDFKVLRLGATSNNPGVFVPSYRMSTPSWSQEDELNSFTLATKYDVSAEISSTTSNILSTIIDLSSIINDISGNSGSTGTGNTGDPDINNALSALALVAGNTSTYWWELVKDKLNSDSPASLRAYSNSNDNTEIRNSLTTSQVNALTSVVNYVDISNTPAGGINDPIVLAFKCEHVYNPQFPFIQYYPTYTFKDAVLTYIKNNGSTDSSYSSPVFDIATLNEHIVPLQNKINELSTIIENLTTQLNELSGKLQ